MVDYARLCEALDIVSKATWDASWGANNMETVEASLQLLRDYIDATAAPDEDEEEGE